MPLSSPFGVVDYSQDCMPKKNVPVVSWPMDMFDVCLSACRCEGLAWLVYIFDVSLLVPAFFSPLVVSIRVSIFELRTLGSSRSEGASGRTQIHLI